MGSSGESFSEVSFLLKWTRILEGVPRLLLDVSHLLYYLLYIPTLRLAPSHATYLSPSLSVEELQKLFKRRRVVIYSCTVGRLMIAHTTPCAGVCVCVCMCVCVAGRGCRGNPKLRFSDTFKKTAAKLRPFNMQIPSAVNFTDLSAALFFFCHGSSRAAFW